MENSLPVFDGAREKEVIERNLAMIKDEKLKPYYRDMIVQLMRISKEYQQNIIDSNKSAEV
jgi:chorismate mutase/prephenate dehydratase